MPKGCLLKLLRTVCLVHSFCLLPVSGSVPSLSPTSSVPLQTWYLHLMPFSHRRPPFRLRSALGFRLVPVPLSRVHVVSVPLSGGRLALIRVGGVVTPPAAVWWSPPTRVGRDAPPPPPARPLCATSPPVVPLLGRGRTRPAQGGAASDAGRGPCWFPVLASRDTPAWVFCTARSDISPLILLNSVVEFQIWYVLILRTEVRKCSGVCL